MLEAQHPAHSGDTPSSETANTPDTAQPVTPNLWDQTECAPWHRALDSYPTIIAAQGSEKLANLDRWYREELPAAIVARSEPCIYLYELQGIAAWKMSRGVWRERNRVLIGGNAPAAVEQASREAFAAVLANPSDIKTPVKLLSGLSGVGAATASAALAAYSPATHPFFDELVAKQVPGLGPVAFTLKYYLAYAQALHEKAAQVAAACNHRFQWTPALISQALWAASGGKGYYQK